MKELIVSTVLMATLACICTGCTATNKLAQGVSEKSISASGTFVLSKTGLNAVNQTPELLNMFIWGDYNSVGDGNEVFRYEQSEDASIFNSASKSKKTKVFFSSADIKRMDMVVDKFAVKQTPGEKVENKQIE